MSRKLRIIISCMLVVLAFGAGIFAYAHTYGNREDTANAVTMPTDYFVDKNGVIVVPPGPNEGNVDNRGTEDNPFFILEIVPYDGMAKVGYMIDGQEPIDVHAMARDNGTVPGQAQYYTSAPATFKFWKSEAPKTFPVSNTMTVNQYGVMTRVEGGTGDYKRVETVDEDNNTTVTYEPDGHGDFEWEPLSLDECIALGEDGETEYNEISHSVNNEGAWVKMYFEDVEYVSGTGKKLVHNDVFLRESIGLAYEFDENGIRHKITNETTINERVDNYKVVVYTVTPEDLNLNLGLIDRADLITISCLAEMIPTPEGESFSGMYVEAPEDELYNASTGEVNAKYKFVPYIKKDKFGYEEPDGQYGRKYNIPGATFNTNRLSWEAVVKIYENSTDPAGICPIVADYDMYDGTDDDAAVSVVLRKMGSDGTTVDAAAANGTQNNLAKLFMLCYQMTNPVFEAFYGQLSAVDGMFESVPMADGSTNKDGSAITTGKFNYDKGWDASKTVDLDEKSKTYWNASTLLPWRVVQSSKLNSLSDYSVAMAPYQVMVAAGPTNLYNMTQYNNTIRNGFLSYDGDNKMGQTFDWQTCGMRDDQYGYEVYDYFESINGYRTSATASVEDGGLTMADCINYLLGGSHGGPSLDTKVYRVLELQPSPDYEDEQWFWKPLIAAHTNSIATPVIETMTTSEFIGSRVDCMGAYDLIYVGVNKFSDANDPAMDFPSDQTQFVYAHTGPKKTIANQYRAMYGWLYASGSAGEEKEKYFVYSGNDLTELALDKLLEYGAEGFPILFGSGFYTNTGVTSVESTIDRNSHVYTLGTTASNRMNCGALSSFTESSKLRDILTTNSKKAEFYFASESDYPIIYSSDTTKSDAQRYINGANNSNRTLKFTFKVLGPAGSKYRVKLFVDANTDGMYKKGEEDLGVTVKKADGTTAAGGVVEAGKTYTVTRSITDRIGSICWKLALVENNAAEEKVYASFSGVSAIKAKADNSEDENILVLQIVPKDASTTLLLPTSEADANANGDASKMFYEKIDGINGMNITFARKTQQQIVDAIKGSGTVSNPEFPNYLYDTYDMLVLGFADIYDGVSDPMVITAIEQFIGYGKAVLYTHDTTSFTGPSGGTFSSWGSTLTQRIRDAYGMDRYGALNNLSPGSVTETIDTPYIPASDTDTDGQIYKNSDEKELRQGYTNGTLWRPLGAGAQNVIARKVSRVNVGAITEYPYNIPEEIDVNDTHPQYYQLDMEEDDMVVWYCLAGGEGGADYENKFYGASPNDVRNNYYIYNKGNVTYSGMGHIMNQDMEREIELFVNTFVAAYRAAAKPVDVKIVNDDATVNAVGEQFLCVDVDSSDAANIIGNDISDSYRLQTFDWSDNKGYVAVTGEEEKKSKRVYFKLVDNNSYGNATYDLKIVLNDGLELDGIQITGEKDDPARDDDNHNKMLAVYDKTTDAFVDNDTIKYKAEDEAIYYVDVPIITEAGEGGRRIVTTTDVKITVTMKYKVGAMEFTVTGDDQVYIMPRGLFNLD